MKTAITLAFIISAGTGCALEDIGPADQTANRSEESSSVPAELATTTNALTESICFVCDFDDSIQRCAPTADRADAQCHRACVVCDDFGNKGECFVGQCSPL